MKLITANAEPVSFFDAYRADRNGKQPTRRPVLIAAPGESVEVDGVEIVAPAAARYWKKNEKMVLYRYEQDGAELFTEWQEIDSEEEPGLIGELESTDVCEWNQNNFWKGLNITDYFRAVAELLAEKYRANPSPRAAYALGRALSRIPEDSTNYNAGEGYERFRIGGLEVTVYALYDLDDFGDTEGLCVECENVSGKPTFYFPMDLLHPDYLGR